MLPTLEIIATNLEDVKIINQSKADQIELVSDLANGGLSPAIATVDAAVKLSRLPINVMLRPHHHSFIYTKDEFANVIYYLKKIKQLVQQPNGIVFGSLTNNNQINEAQLQQIIEAKGKLHLVFHRAFDELSNYKEGIETLNKYPEVHALLTSGTKPKATIGVQIIRELVQFSTPSIMVGSGVNADNIKELQKLSKAENFHVGTAVRENNNANAPILLDEINRIKDEMF